MPKRQNSIKINIARLALNQSLWLQMMKFMKMLSFFLANDIFKWKTRWNTRQNSLRPNMIVHFTTSFWELVWKTVGRKLLRKKCWKLTVEYNFFHDQTFKYIFIYIYMFGCVYVCIRGYWKLFSPTIKRGSILIDFCGMVGETWEMIYLSLLLSCQKLFNIFLFIRRKYLHIYIYIYICVCVCVCNAFKNVLMFNIDKISLKWLRYSKIRKKRDPLFRSCLFRKMLPWYLS